MPDPRIIVLKFGGSVLRSERDLAAATAEIYRWHREGLKVVAVVSAYLGITDRLADEAGHWGAGCPAARASLLGAGETRSAAHLTLAAGRCGLRSRLVPVAEARLVAEGMWCESRPVAVDGVRLRSLLAAHDVLVVPGFQAVGRDGQPRLLGRGGSDLTALFLAERLGAVCCRLIKDTDGLFEWDPRLPGPRPRRFRSITWNDTATLDDTVIQPRALAFARQYQRPFDFAARGSGGGTVVGAATTELVPAVEIRPPLRVAVAGCGTVGGGVLRLLADLEDVTITGVAVRTAARTRPEIRADIPVFTDPVDLLTTNPDVVVETMGGLGVADELLQAALARGLAVVTANKDLLAARGRELRALAVRCGGWIGSAATCGGGAPMLERTARLGRRRRLVTIRGVVNGTSNWILDRLVDGVALDTAVAEAQAAGYAESDPTADLAGHDAARKICLLVHAAWGLELAPSQVVTTGLESLTVDAVIAARRRGLRPRLVASARRVGCGVQASVEVRILPPADPLHEVAGVANRLELRDEAGECWLVDGLGAGRWPTAQAVLADVLAAAARRSGVAASSEPGVRLRRTGS